MTASVKGSVRRDKIVLRASHPCSRSEIDVMLDLAYACMQPHLRIGPCRLMRTEIYYSTDPSQLAGALAAYGFTKSQSAGFEISFVTLPTQVQVLTELMLSRCAPRVSHHVSGDSRSSFEVLIQATSVQVPAAHRSETKFHYSTW